MTSPSSAPVAPDTNHAPTYLIPCGLLSVLALALCVARIYSRLQPRPLLLPSDSRLSPDDYLIAAATFTCVVSYSVAVGSATHGWGHLSAYVSPSDRVIAFKCLLVQQSFGILGAALVRTSVAWSLLRFSTWGPWKYSLWAMMGIQVLTYIGLIVLMLGNCRPLRSFWEPVYPKPHCWDRKYSVTYGWVANIILIIMDFFLATMPIQLIRTLHRPRREKILVGCLMAMGLLATAVAGYKMTLSKKVFLGDTLSTTVELSLWNRIEILVGLIAACLPCLKSPAEKVLVRLGVFTRNLDITMVSFNISLTPQTSNSSSDKWTTEDKTQTAPSSSTHLSV